MAREITERPTFDQGISLTNLFNEDVIDHIAESAWRRFRTIFTSFGTTSAGLIGLIIIIRLFEWSLYLLGAFWDSPLTSYYT